MNDSQGNVVGINPNHATVSSNNCTASPELANGSVVNGISGKLDSIVGGPNTHTNSESNSSMEKSDLNESSSNIETGESCDQQEASASAITSKSGESKSKSPTMAKTSTTESTNSKSTGRKVTPSVSSKSKVHSSSGTASVSSSRLTSDFPLRIVVQSDMVGAIIGKSGGTIKDITKDSKARVDVLRKESNNSTDKVIAIYGTPENCSKAALKIVEVIMEEAKAIGKTGEDTPQLRILAHNALIGRVIGKSGNTIKRVMESTDTKITVSQSIFDPINAFNPERIITIKGDSVESVSKAESQITAKLRSSYESDFSFLASQPSTGLMAFSGLSPAMPMLPGGPLSTPAHLHQAHHSHHPHARGSNGGSAAAGSGPAGPSVPPFTAGLYGPAAFLPPSAAAAALLHHHPHAYPYHAAASGASPLSPGHGAAAAAAAAAVAGLAGPPYLHVEQVKETAVVYIPHTAVGAVIGSGGATIRDMMNNSGASIKVAQSPSKDTASQGSPGDSCSSSSSSSSRERKVTIVGTPEAQWKAQMLVFRKVLHEAGLPGESTLKVEIMVPSSQVGRIIGKSGNTVRELQRLTRAQIKLPEPEERTNSSAADVDAETPVSIIGDFLSSQSAQRQIRALVTRGQLSSQLASSESYSTK